MFTNHSNYRLIRTNFVLLFCLALAFAFGCGMAFAADVQLTHPAVVDSAVLPGVSVAGTPGRINNLDKVESMLNTIAISGLLIGVLTSLLLVNRARLNASISPKQKGIRYAMAFMIALLALSLPGTVDWLVAPARDASLCDNFF